MAATSKRTFADLLMILAAAPFIVWWFVLVAVAIGWQPLDLTTGAIFFIFGALTYMGVLFVGGGSAIWAIRYAKSQGMMLHSSSRLLVSGTVTLIVFPWVAIPIIQSIRGIW